MRAMRDPSTKRRPISNGRARAEVPDKVLAKLRAICLTLPEAYEETAWVGTRWMVRKRNFAHVLAIRDRWPPAYARAAGADGVVLTFRVSALDYGAFDGADPRFFPCEWGTLWGTKVVGLKLGRSIAWGEVEALVVESYRLLAPKKLATAVRAAALRGT